MLIRICQFHIIQAIRRWDHELTTGNKKTKGKRRRRKTTSLPEKALVDILHAFRSTQRCRNIDDWPEAQAAFENRLFTVCVNYDVEDLNATLVEYFRENWWCDDWRGEDYPVQY